MAEGNRRSESRQRTKMIPVRATPEEKQALKDRAYDSGMPLSEFLRRAGLGKKISSVVDSRAVVGVNNSVVELRKIGGLLKLWLAKRGAFEASDVEEVDPREIRAILRDLRAAEMELIQHADKLRDDH